MFSCVSKKTVCFFNYFWFFLRSRSCIGSSGRLVGRIPQSFVQIHLSDTELSPNVVNMWLDNCFSYIVPSS